MKLGMALNKEIEMNQRCAYARKELQKYLYLIKQNAHIYQLEIHEQ